eukprot:TRINITY_DN32703_c0_g1_i1.p1 TRINITY_DN32703_c0_g1~~TRINITY_DN32703_c0_g1_i1.p1  ORF type:complete len:851 (+),score=163.52 TRINITY_DN32703_c0_g1_i1:77-2629(+)
MRGGGAPATPEAPRSGAGRPTTSVPVPVPRVPLAVSMFGSSLPVSVRIQVSPSPGSVPNSMLRGSLPKNASMSRRPPRPGVGLSAPTGSVPMPVPKNRQGTHGSMFSTSVQTAQTHYGTSVPASLPVPTPWRVSTSPAGGRSHMPRGTPSGLRQPSTSVLSQCTSEGPVVISDLQSLSRVSRVRVEDLRNAIRARHGGGAERVAVTAADGTVMVEGGGGFLDSNALAMAGSLLTPATTALAGSETPGVLSPPPFALAREGSALTQLTDARIGGTVTSYCSEHDNSSVAVGKPHRDVDPVYMIPTAEGTTVVVMDSTQKKKKHPKLVLDNALPSVIKEVKEIGVVEQDGQWYGYIILEYARPVVIWLALIAATVGLASKAVVADHMYLGVSTTGNATISSTVTLSRLLASNGTAATVAPDAVSEGPSAIAKSVWMNLISFAFFVLLAATDLRSVGLRDQFRELCTAKSSTMLRVYLLGSAEPPPHLHSRLCVPYFGVLMIVVASILHGLFSVFFVLSLHYTSLENCVVLMNLHPVLVMIPRFTRTTSKERFGAFLVAAGTCSLIITSPDRAGNTSPLTGNILAFMVSVFMWIYLSLSQPLQAALPSGLLMALILFGSCVVQVALFPFLSNASDQPVQGMVEYILPNFLGGFCGGFMAYGGFMIAGRYLNPLVVSVNITLEPIYSVILQLLFVHIYPPLLSWASLLVLVVGAMMCALGGRNEHDDVVLKDSSSAYGQSLGEEGLPLHATPGGAPLDASGLLCLPEGFFSDASPGPNINESTDEPVMRTPSLVASQQEPSEPCTPILPMAKSVKSMRRMAGNTDRTGSPKQGPGRTALEQAPPSPSSVVSGTL